MFYRTFGSVDQIAGEIGTFSTYSHGLYRIYRTRTARFRLYWNAKIAVQYTVHYSVGSVQHHYSATWTCTQYCGFPVMSFIINSRGPPRNGRTGSNHSTVPQGKVTSVIRRNMHLCDTALCSWYPIPQSYVQLIPTATLNTAAPLNMIEASH